MNITQIREKIAEHLSMDDAWEERLNDTDPSHCGIEDWQVDIDENDIIVDEQKQEFSFKNASFSFTAMLGSSSDGFSANFVKIATGKGTYEIIDPNDVSLEDIEIQVDLDLMEEEEE